MYFLTTYTTKNHKIKNTVDTISSLYASLEAFKIKLQSVAAGVDVLVYDRDAKIVAYGRDNKVLRLAN